MDCIPNIIFISFSLIHIIIDLYKHLFDDALIKFIIMIIISLVINILCKSGLTIIAWFFVFIPIIMMTIISTLLLKVFTDKNMKQKLNYNEINAKVSNEMQNGYYYKDNKYYYKNHNGDIYYFDKDGNQYLYTKNTEINNNNDDDISNRDKIRKDLYDKIEKEYNLNSNKEDMYDLSNNKIKYNIVDNYLSNNFFSMYNNIFYHNPYFNQ